MRYAFEVMAAPSAAGSLYYVCIDLKHLTEMTSAGEAVYSKHPNTCVWAKDRAGMGAFYRSQTEIVLSARMATPSTGTTSSSVATAGTDRAFVRSPQLAGFAVARASICLLVTRPASRSPLSQMLFSIVLSAARSSWTPLWGLEQDLLLPSALGVSPTLRCTRQLSATSYKTEPTRCWPITSKAPVVSNGHGQACG